jgi:hypothetical protein
MLAQLGARFRPGDAVRWYDLKLKGWRRGFVSKTLPPPGKVRVQMQPYRAGVVDDVLVDASHCQRDRSANAEQPNPSTAAERSANE